MSDENKPSKMIIVMSVTAVVVAGILAGFYQAVLPRIEANREAEIKRAIFAVVEGAKSYDIDDVVITNDAGAKETVRIFKGKDDAGNVIGYAFIADEPGFAGTISMMVGLNVDRKRLLALSVTDQVETPGLGNIIVEDKFTVQFKGLEVEPKIEYVKNKKPEKPNQIQAITGATISSRAIVNGINRRLVAVLKALAVEDAEPKGK